MSGIIGRIPSRSNIVLSYATVGQGGTGASTFTDGGVLLGSGVGAVTATAALADSEMLVGDGTTDPAIESGATLRTSIGVGTGDAVTFATVNTGQGANELYDMDQNVKTDSAVSFTTVNTGQGANELYDMNQNVLTTSGVTHDKLTATTGVLFGSDTAAANTLDDYEEGVYTPAVSEGTAFSNAQGSYIKIGTLCHVSGRFDLNAFTNGTVANFSLPFASASGDEHEGSGCFYSNGTANDLSDYRFKNVSGLAQANVKDGATALVYTSWTSGSPTGWLFGFTYKTA